MQDSYPGYSPADWSLRLETCAKNADRYALCECTGIRISANERKTIETIGSKVLERLAFTLLCLAKFNDFRNPANNHWISYSNGEIYKTACINATAFNKDSNYHRHRELGLIEYAKKVNNLNIRVLFIDENGGEALFVSDFRTLGYEWRLLKGERYIRCTGCGLLVKDTNGKRKYCKDCAAAGKRMLDRQRMQRRRSLQICES